MKKQIIATLKSELQRNLADYNEHLIIRAMLLPYEGKKITTAMRLDAGYKIIRGQDYYIISDKNGNPHMVCSIKKSDDFTIGCFDRTDSSFGSGAKGRAEKLQAVLNDAGDLIKAIQRLHKANEAFYKLVDEVFKVKSFDSYHNPAFYKLLQAAGVSHRLIAGIKRREFEV